MSQIDIYRPQFMLRVAQATPKIHTLLKDSFFRRQHLSLTKHVTFDLIKDGQPMAPFTGDGIGGTLSEREGFETHQFTPPLVAPFRVLTQDDVNTRMAGEAVFNGLNPNSRRVKLLRDDIVALNREITRREEWMVAQTLFNGKMDIVGDGVNRTIDFGFSNYIDAENPWSNTEKANPHIDIRKAKQLASKSGYTPNVMIMNSDTLDFILENKKMLGLLDNSGVRIGVIEPRIMRNGGTFIGHLRQTGLDLYTYDEEYRDVKNGVATRKPLVPDGKVLIASTNTPAVMLYGAIHNEKQGSVAAPRVPHTYFSLNGDIRFFRLSCRPLPCPVDVSSWAVLNVLAKGKG